MTDWQTDQLNFFLKIWIRQATKQWNSSGFLAKDCPIGGGCRIHQLFLCEGKVSRYEAKQSDAEFQ